MREFLDSSMPLVAAGCVWYSNLTLIREIRRRAIDLRGLIIEKCDSPRLLLAVADQPETKGPSFATFRFGDENVLAVMSKETFSFSTR